MAIYVKKSTYFLLGIAAAAENNVLTIIQFLSRVAHVHTFMFLDEEFADRWIGDRGHIE